MERGLSSEGLIQLDKFVEYMLVQLQTPYCCPKVRIERRECERCERETDHEVGLWPEDPFTHRLILGLSRRVVRCLTCGHCPHRASRLDHWEKILTIPRIGEVYPPLYRQPSA